MITEQIVRIETDGDETRAEVVGEIVRCKDCKYYLYSSEICGIIDTRLHFYETHKRWYDDSFCSWGERKETEDGEIH